MNKFDQAFKKYIVEDAEERAWEQRQIQDAAKKAKAMKKKGEKVNFNQLADDYGVSANDIKKACNEGYIKENTEDIPFQTQYRFGMSEEECEDGNIVMDAYSKIPYTDFRKWEEKNWDKMSDYEKEVSENIQASIEEGYY